MNTISNCSLLWKTITPHPVLLNQQLTTPLKMPCKPWEKKRKSRKTRWAPKKQPVHIKPLEILSIYWLALDSGITSCTATAQPASSGHNPQQWTGNILWLKQKCSQLFTIFIASGGNYYSPCEASSIYKDCQQKQQLRGKESLQRRSKLYISQPYLKLSFIIVFLHFFLLQAVVAAGPVEPAGEPASAKKRSSSKVSIVTENPNFKVFNTFGNTRCV